MSDLTPWMTTSDTYLDHTKEVRGGENPVILNFFREAGHPQEEDEVAWCSAYQNAIMFETPGCARFMTHNLMAKSWLHAPECDEIEPEDAKFGDIVILNSPSRGSEYGHVTNFVEWVGDDKDYFKGQGGNQHDSVDKSNFSSSLIAGVRRPRYVAAYETPAVTPTELTVAAGTSAAAVQVAHSATMWWAIGISVVMAVGFLVWIGWKQGWFDKWLKSNSTKTDSTPPPSV